MADYLAVWRERLKENLKVFASLAKADYTIDRIFGVIGASVLWAIREKTAEQVATLKVACADEAQQMLLLEALDGWKKRTEAEALHELNREQDKNPLLQEALKTLMGYFVKDLFEEKALAYNQNISIEGNISGANVVVGGRQVVVGDLIIHYTIQQKIRACPTAPKPPVHFAGRQTEIDEIKNLLRKKQNTALTSIQGMGGIGKTALAQKLASELPEFSAVLWASIGQTPNPINTLINWAQHSDTDFNPSEEERKDPERLALRVQALLTNLIKEQCPGTTLLILDDIWDGEGVSAARWLQKAVPVDSVTLITTRSQLVVAQLRSTRVELGYMTPTDALQMLRNLLGKYPAIPDDTLLLLAKTVSYHPLALELAAGQVGLLERPTQDIADLIKRYQGGIPSGSPFREIKLELGEDREDNLELILSFSYASLTEAEQVQFRALGVLAYDAPFSRELCEAIWRDAPQHGLDSLRHRAMLTIAEEQGWYQQHPLLRAYARALLIQHHEIDDRLMDYSEFVTQSSNGFRTLPLEQWSQLDPLLPHVHSVGDELLKVWKYTDGENDRLTQCISNFVWNISSYIDYRPQAIKNGDEVIIYGMNWLEMGLNVFKVQNNKERESIILNKIGAVWSILGKKHEALKFYNKALDLSKDTNNKIVEIESINNIGVILSILGKNSESLELYTKALNLSKEIAYKRGEMKLLDNIGKLYRNTGLFYKAIEIYNSALVLAKEINNKRDEGLIINNIGRTWSALGKKTEALDFYNQALELIRMVGDKISEAIILSNIGSTWVSLGERFKAIEFFNQALLLNKETGSVSSEATMLSNIGTTWNLLGEKQKALEFFMQTLSIFKIIGDKSSESTILNNIGRCYDELNNFELALNYYNQALNLRQKIGNRLGEAITLNNIGGLWSSLNEKQKALTFYNQALQIFIDVDATHYVFTSRINIANILESINNFNEAIKQVEITLTSMNERGFSSTASGRTITELEQYLLQLKSLKNSFGQ